MTESPETAQGETSLDSVWAVVERARDAITVRRVFGDPVERDGVTVVPAAAVRGGGGGGGAEGADGTAGGTGYGLAGRPVGAYVIREGDARWEPVVDRTRVIIGSQIVVAVALLLVTAAVRSRSSTSRHRRPWRVGLWLLRRAASRRR